MKTALSLVALMLLSSVLPGCLETVSDVIEEESTHPYAAPEEAMGMWWPMIDGYIEIPTVSPITEWYDSDMKDIKFTDEMKAEHPATLRYKSVEEGLALAVEIDGVEETPQKITVTLPDRTLVTEVTAESDNLLPQFEIDCTMTLAFDCSDDESKKIIDKDHLMSVELIDFLSNNEIASVHNLDDDNLVMEASAKQLFDDTTEVSYTITIEFEESIWIYTTIVDFNWILPFLFPRSDISVTGIEVTQAVQTADMQMRLVEGKTSLARVYVDSGDLETANVEVTLHFCIVIFCFDKMGPIPHIAVQNPDRTDFTHSANFVLPDHWVTFDGIDDPIPIGLIAKITPIYPTGAIDYVDPDTSNNHEVGVFWFNHTRDLVVWSVPVPQDTNGDGVVETRPAATITNWMQDTEAMFPTANIVEVPLPSTGLPDMTGLTNDQINAQMFPLLIGTQISIIFDSVLNGGELTPPLPDQMHGVNPAGGTGGGFADADWWALQCGASCLGQEIGTSILSWCGNSVANYGATPQFSACPAHEIIHNLGPNNWDGDGDGFDSNGLDEDWGHHVGPRCNAGGADSVWTNNFGTDLSIKDLGWDALAVDPTGATNTLALISAGYPDVMGYCQAGAGTFAGIQPARVPQWMSTYHWEYLYDRLQNWDPANIADGRSEVNQNSTYRFISGIVPMSSRTQASLDHSFSAPGLVPNSLQKYGDKMTSPEYNIVTKDSNGDVLERINFTPYFANIHGNNTDFFFNYVVQDDGNIFSIELLHNGTMVDNLYSSGQPTIRMLPLGTAEYTRENPANLSWTQASPTSNHETLYQLEYSWGSDIWLPIGRMTNSTSTILDFGTLPATMQGADSKFRVRATNGFDTYYSESTSFSVPNQAPVLTLETSGALGLQSRWAEIGGTNTPITITQGESFSITPEITDADWTPVNEDGLNAVLKRDGEIVWADGRDNNWNAPNRVVSWPAWNRPLAEAGSGNICGDGVVGGTMCSFNFPNADLLPGEMTPGDYDFEVTYEDEAGSSVTKTVSFSIIVPNFLVGPDSNAKTGDVLDEYRSKLEMMSNISKMNNDLSRDELRYYVELERAARGDNDALSDADIIALQEFYGISDSRVKELQDMANSVTTDDSDDGADTEGR